MIRLQIIAVSLVLGLGTTAKAHFPWLSTNDQGQALLWFGESVGDTTYKMPEPIAKAVLHCGRAVADMESLETDDFIGMRSLKPIDLLKEVHMTGVYGNYHGTKLTYFAEHLPHRNATSWPTEPRKNAVMQTVVMPPKDDAIEVMVLHQSKPLPDVEVKLFDSQGELASSAKTDDQGKVAFAIKEVPSGLNALMVGFENEKSGTYNDQPYQSESYYLTSTFFHQGKAPAKEASMIQVDPTSECRIVSSQYADLPEELTSFGAAVLGQTVYVYGGHTGDAHSYSTVEQSDRFWALDLSDVNNDWVKLPSGPRLQGLALVAVGGKLVRLGGFTAMNEKGEEHDLRSQTLVAAFDPSLKVWSELPELPEPRSSFDAVAVGDVIYVAGGWSMQGGEETVWHRSAWSMDLSDANPTWKALPEPPFQRRALSLAAAGDKLFVIGGMQKSGGPTTRVDVYDLQSKTWSIGPAIPGKGMSGFGTAAFSLGDKLYVSAMDGFVHRLSRDGNGWQTIAKQDPSRFFHRMVPIARGEMMLIGGANMQIGKFTDLEVLKVR